MQTIHKISDIFSKKKSDNFCEDISEKTIHKNRLECAGFLAESLSHDLKNILNVISGYSDLGIISNQIPDCKKYFQANIESGHKAVRILNTFSMIANGHYRTEKDIFDLSDLVKAIICLLKFSSRKLNTSITFEHDENKKYIIAADKEKILQIILNLSINALNAIENTELKGELGFKLFLQKNEVNLTIYDNGGGMTEMMKTDILLYFKNGNSSTKSEYAGTGLRVVKALSENQGGELKLKTSIGKGTEVTLTLPKIGESASLSL